jgi:hypothetical protein
MSMDAPAVDMRRITTGGYVETDGVLRKYGPEPVHEAQALVDALTAILADPKAETFAAHRGFDEV